MRFGPIIIVGLSLCAICCVSDLGDPTSAARSAELPDLTILDVTYRYHGNAPGWVSIAFALRIQNIGRVSFDSLLYVFWTGTKHDLRDGYFSHGALIHYDWSGPSVRPEPVAAGEIIEEKVYSLPMLDTNIVRFRIVTDRRGLRDADLYPLVAESNYDNNDFSVTVIAP